MAQGRAKTMVLVGRRTESWRSACWLVRWGYCHTLFLSPSLPLSAQLSIASPTCALSAPEWAHSRPASKLMLRAVCCVQLVVSPLFRLVSKPNAQLQDLGPPERVVESVGNFITGESVQQLVAAHGVVNCKLQPCATDRSRGVTTILQLCSAMAHTQPSRSIDIHQTLPSCLPGTYLDEEDVQSATVDKLADGRECYLYEINAPYAQNGNHCLAALTIKVWGEVASPGRRPLLKYCLPKPAVLQLCWGPPCTH